MPSVSSNEKTSNTLDLDATRRLSATPTARHFRADGGGGQGHTTVLQPSMPHTERQAHTRPPREREERAVLGLSWTERSSWETPLAPSRLRP